MSQKPATTPNDKKPKESIKQMSKDERQRMVFKLRMRGVSQERCAEILQVARKTIERDEEEIEKKKKKWFSNLKKNFNPEEYYRKQIETLEQMIDELWSVYAEGNAKDRVRALEMISSFQKEIDDRMKKAGIHTSESDHDEKEGVRIVGLEEAIKKIYGQNK